MIGPVEDDPNAPEHLCSLTIRLLRLKGYISYEFDLDLPDEDDISLSELKALRAGLIESATRLTELINRFEDDPGQED